MRKCKRLLVLVLALSLVASVTQVGAFASVTGDNSPPKTEYETDAIAASETGEEDVSSDLQDIVTDTENPDEFISIDLGDTSQELTNDDTTEAAEAAQADADDAETEDSVNADETVEAKEAGAAEISAEQADSPEAESSEKTYIAKDQGVKVTAVTSADALPEGAELFVTLFDKDSEEYQEAAKAIGHDTDDANMAAMDISFVADGEEVEPDDAVKVSIDASEILPPTLMVLLCKYNIW